MQFKIGIPSNGWLPVEIKGKGFDIAFMASNVPIDPIPSLVDALILAINGSGNEVWWHLEPAGYFMSVQQKEEKYVLSLSYSPASKANSKTQKLSVSGTAQEIIVPIWRALREFNSHGYTKPDWPEGDSSGMDILTELVRKIKRIKGPTSV